MSTSPYPDMPAEAKRAARRALQGQGLAPLWGATRIHGLPREPNGRVLRSYRGPRPKRYSADSIFRKILRSTVEIQLGAVEVPPTPMYFKVARVGLLTEREFLISLLWLIVKCLPLCWQPAVAVAALSGVKINDMDCASARTVAFDKLDARTIALLDSVLRSPEPDVTALRPALTALIAVWGAQAGVAEMST